jgi:chromosome segregation ATPase
MRGLFFVVLWCLSAGVFSAASQDLARLSDVERKQVNAWMAERAETMARAHKLESEISGAWANTTYSSPETETLRARYRELQQEMTRVQAELQKKVQEVPAVQEKARQVDEANRKAQALLKQITEKTGGKQ